MPRSVSAMFELIAEIDFCLWSLETMLAQEKRLSVIERMVDDATGFDRTKLKEAKRLMRRIRLLKKRLALLRGDGEGETASGVAGAESLAVDTPIEGELTAQ